MSRSFHADLCFALLGKSLSLGDLLLFFNEHKYYIGTKRTDSELFQFLIVPRQPLTHYLADDSSSWQAPRRPSV